ncbi:MAG: iron-sulfur cluster repair di-iron protein [Balneolaceae bacterium]
MNIQEHDMIGELVAQDYRAAAVFKNYGIDFCCQGSRTISDACIKDNVDAQAVVKDLNAISESSDDRATDYKSWPVDLLTHYITKTHHRYVREKCIEIKPYLDKICRVHGRSHPELLKINEHFLDTDREMAHHMVEEETIVFPLINEMDEAIQTGVVSEKLRSTAIKNPIQKMMDEHLAEGDRFREIERLTNNYTPPEDACNTYRVTFALLKEFEQDLHLHIHLENNILFPRAIEFERQLQN